MYQITIVNGNKLFPRFKNMEGISLSRHERAILDDIFEAFTKEICLHAPIRMQTEIYTLGLVFLNINLEHTCILKQS